MPKISVVMSIFNGEKYLDAAVNSILNQTFPDFEFIIIDDCSTDDSYKILQEFSKKDSRIRLYKSEKNIGVQGFIRNLNWGISLANGEYIARMDQDDISDAQRFQKQISFFNSNQEIDFLGSQISLMNTEGKKTGELRAPTGNHEIQKKMPKKISLYHPVIMFRNKGFRYREKMLYCEDYDLYLNAMTMGAKFANLPDFLLDYRVHQKSMSRKNIFVRNLFVEKCRSFYIERKKTAKDGYEKFSPEIFQEILNSRTETDQENLKFILKTALKFGNLEEFDLLMNRQGKKPGTLIYRLLRNTPQKFRRAIFKII